MIAHCQTLESRVLLTYIGFRDSRVLTIEANEGDDVVIVTVIPGGIRINVNNEPPAIVDRAPRQASHLLQWLHVEGLGGNDTIRVDPAGLGTPFGVDLNGNDGDDLLECGSGHLSETGGDGNDTLRASGSGLNELEGDAGDDMIVASAGTCQVTGGSGRDFIQLAGGDDLVWGGPGRDTLLTSGGDDTILGGRGDDFIDAGDGDDWIFGQQGDDTLLGGTGTDALFGQDGNDSLDGGTGPDVLFTGAGGTDTATTSTDLTDRLHRREYRHLDALLNTQVPTAVRRR